MVVQWDGVNWYDYLSSFGICERQKGQRKRHDDEREILNVFSAFDIETSIVWLNEDHSLYDVHAFMYSWAMQIEDYTILGREWDDFFLFLANLCKCLDKIREKYRLPKMPRLVCWVHNLAYEWSWLSGLYDFKNEDVFFRDVRKPIYCRMFDCIEFRCSYIQSNLSLSMLCKQMGVPEKKSGQKFDYSKIRFPWTPLTDYELEYIITDVESLVLAMKKRVSMGGDSLVTVPLTSTGYVRRDCKRALQPLWYDIRDMKPSERQYRLLRRAFRGGNTHANRAMVAKVIDDVYSYDIVSCYPTQQLTMKFPVKPFRWLDDRCTLDRVLKYMGLGYAVVGLYQFKGIRLKNKREPIPYISLGRCEATEWKLDNGRILEADFVEMALTEYDLEIVLRQYDYDAIEVIECMVAQKAPLPEEYRKVIMHYYEQKTTLKGTTDEEELTLYQLFKGFLNAIYGMSATDPIHQTITYDKGEYNRSSYSTMTKEEIEKALKSAPFPYQWGVYTTALSRYQLQKAIDLCGNKIIYCDTDSVKTKGPAPIEKLNDYQLRKATSAGAFADDRKGTRHYIGVFEQDAHYEKFITQGAKRYAYIKNGKMGVTVSGVTKQINEETGIPFAVEELKSLERFRPGMTWEKAGGTMAVYNDKDDFDYTDPETGRTVHISPNVAIIPTTYTLTYEKDYSLLLDEIKLYGEYKSMRE